MKHLLLNSMRNVFWIGVCLIAFSACGPQRLRGTLGQKQYDFSTRRHVSGNLGVPISYRNSANDSSGFLGGSQLFGGLTTGGATLGNTGLKKDLLISDHIQGVGFDVWKSVSKKARHVLKIRFLPEDCSDCDYTVLAVTVQVGNKQCTTSLLDIALGESSGVMQFEVPQEKCTSDDPDCREDVEIKIGKPHYDYWYVNYGMYGHSEDQRDFSLTYSKVYKSHPWQGTLYVETDDTEALPDQTCNRDPMTGVPLCDRPRCVHVKK